MPTDVTPPSTTQVQSVDIMPTTMQKASGELAQTTPAFSYAQAAKGRSPSVPTTFPNSKTLSDTIEPDSKSKSISDTPKSTVDSDILPMKRTASEGRASSGGSFKASEERSINQSDNNKEATKTDTPSEKSSSLAPSRQNGSTPSSPGYGTTSTSTLPKEDDVFSNVNGSLDSASDKQSQTSQSGSKEGEKVETEKAQNAEAEKLSWDEETSATASLKEAPAPIVNIWQQRKEAQAKSKQSAPPTSTKAPMINNGMGNANGPARGAEASPESKKQEGRKKGKAGPGNAEERPAAGISREGSKSVDAADRPAPAPMAPPPPPGDAVSWPTFDTTLGDGKKKIQDQTEKVDKDPSHPVKPHGKEKWVPVPFVPTAVFNTPMPTARRGGRPQRGGREGGSRAGNTAGPPNGTERSMAGAAGTSNGQVSATAGIERGRGVLGSITSSNPLKPKRASSAGPTTLQEQRKPGAAAPEQRKGSDVDLSKPRQENGTLPKDSRRPSAALSTQDPQASRSLGNAPVNEPGKTTTDMVRHKPEEGRKDQNGTDPHGHSRQGQSERRSEGLSRSLDLLRDANGHLPMRERGRGGYRGRGGPNHAYFSPTNGPNGHGYPNGYQVPYQGPPAPQSKPYSNHERLSSQHQSYQPPNPQGRHFRASSRSQSIPNPAPHGRFGNGYHGPPHLTQLQTDVANEYGYQPGNQGIMSAMPYNPMMEEMYPSLLGMLQIQLEYYFSIENLCKDLHLRKAMDSQGFVPLHLVMSFNRMKALTTDPRMVYLACRSIPQVELIHIDGVDRIRRRDDNPTDGWPKWVLDMDLRYDEAKNDGPVLPPLQPPHPFDIPQPMDDSQHFSPRSNAMGTALDQAQYQPINGVAAQFAPSLVGGAANGANDSVTRTPLSAAVSDFSPSVRSASQRQFSTPDPQAQATNVFTDEQVDNLNILVRKSGNAATTSPPPFHTASSRTFSNGSIDGRSITEELSRFADRQPRPTTNGELSPRSVHVLLNHRDQG